MFLQAKGVQVVAVGIGHSIDKKELKQIAYGNNNNVYLINSFQVLRTVGLKKLKNVVCGKRGKHCY